MRFQAQIRMKRQIAEGEKYYAAIELDLSNGTVLQAYGPHNDPIEEQEDVERAFSLWVRKNGYVRDDEEDLAAELREARAIMAACEEYPFL